MRRLAVPGLFSQAPWLGPTAAVAAAALAVSLTWAATPAQVPPAPAASAVTPAASAASSPKPTAPAASAPVRTAPKPAPVGRAARPSGSPAWRELGPAEQQALAPLSADWDRLSAAQKRKWRALSRNFSRLSPDEQAKLHSRMTEWVSLSPQQRTLARLNFGAAKQVPADERKAKWQAYQALSAEEKRKLAAGAARPPVTAPAIRPVAPGRLATVPRPKSAGSAPRHGIVAPGKLDRHTLLPRKHPASAPVMPARRPAAPASAPASAAIPSAPTASAAAAPLAPASAAAAPAASTPAKAG